MFFPERITRISSADKVLEIGPGADPHPRSDVLLELAYESPDDYAKQFGHDRKLVTDKKVIFYDGKKFPFGDKEFDYVICAHVIEHVEDVEGFLSEIFRVSKRGYMEYPLAYYEYLYNFNVHLNYVKLNNGVLNYMKKSESSLDEFRPLQDFFRGLQMKGHMEMVDELLPQFMEGFEWEKPFEAKRVNSLAQVCFTELNFPPVKEKPLTTYGSKRLLKEFLKSMTNRIR